MIFVFMTETSEQKGERQREGDDDIKMAAAMFREMAFYESLQCPFLAYIASSSLRFSQSFFSELLFIFSFNSAPHFCRLAT